MDGVTIVVLPCKENDEHLGLILHPAQDDETRSPSHRLHYVTWTFYLPTVSVYWTSRLACLGDDPYNLRFCGKRITPTWKGIYIAAHLPTTERRDGAHLLQRFVPDVAPTAFRVPRTLMQALDALGFLLITSAKSWDPASKDTILLECQDVVAIEAVYILLGTCKKASTMTRPCHWAWADQRHSTTWNQPWPEYAHDCATDHIEDWPNSTREFGDTERTIRLVFAPCKHALGRTLVFGLELVGSRYEEIQQKANIFIHPHVKSPALIGVPEGSASGGLFSGLHVPHG